MRYIHSPRQTKLSIKLNFMKRVHFFIYDELAEQINKAINRWGFNSQSEFFRFLAMEFIRNEKKRGNQN